MYLEHFGLVEPPFRITPHPDFFFDGADRGATLEGLQYAILHDEGIVKVSGEIGSGKTTLCKVLMERLPAEVETVFLANPTYSRSEILHAIAEELGRPANANPAASALRELQTQLIGLYASGRRVVVMIDEAHAMPEDTLEQVRLLSNLESSRHKLLQIVLFGQPELDTALDKPSMRQLKDRITHSFRTRPLNTSEAGSYIAFRMRAAGYRGRDVFTPAAVSAIARASSGLTRRINVLCDKALLAAFAANTHAVTPRQVRAAIADSDFAPVPGSPDRSKRTLAAVGLIAAGAIAGAGLFYWLDRSANPLPPPSTTPAAKSPPAPAVPAAPAQATAEPPPPSAVPAPEEAKPPPSEDTQGAAKPSSLPPAPEASEKLSVPLLAPEKLRRLEGYSPGRNPLLRERIASAREKLLSEPDSSYGIELFVAENSEGARAERFLVRAGELVPLTEIQVIPVATGARYFLRVTYGAYPSREAALEAIKRLPPKYQKAFQLEPRSFAELRAAI
ncbi:MAG: AAA family ATPase [Candidatus Parcubacteria bacterium]|nr:AAA family ATPase [Burkholderiales bacterium]